jgi:predicted DNA-binding transcriptional regulator AlpA
MSAPATLPDDYLTIDQVATELDIAVITLKRWAALKQGPPVTKIGRRVVYRRSSVQQWLVKQEQKHAVARRTRDGQELFERRCFSLNAGAARGIRTPDPIITNDVLYRLSYCGLTNKIKALHEMNKSKQTEASGWVSNR